MTTICTAGHRPNRLGGYELHVAQRLMTVARFALDELKPSQVVCGMAIGWDMALGLAAVEYGIPLVCAVPFQGFKHVSPTAQRTFDRLVEASVDTIELASPPGVAPSELFKRRNEWMVDHSDSVAALWSGDHSSGTWHCIRYAIEKRKPVDNFWSAFTAQPV